MDIEEQCKCPSCGKEYSVIIPKYPFEQWKYVGKRIQDAWPEGSATDHESLISGLCPECQKKVFEEQEEKKPGFDYEGHWITDPHWDPTHRWRFDTEHDACLFYGFPDNFHTLWQTTESLEKYMYDTMMTRYDLENNCDDFYDVDMFRTDICNDLFTETDPQDIDEDDYLPFQMALIMLVGTPELVDEFGYDGLAVLHAELIHDGENYYVNKTCWKED